MPNIIDMIDKKVNHQVLSNEEIKYFIKNYDNGTIKDYQASALLMAILLNGMSNEETSYLTSAMLNSGETLNLDQIHGIKVDKHSTGGVGDKTTLVIGPIVASLGAPVAKMSGRGLGHTGGTIDKLDSIPGFKTGLTIKEFINNVNKHKLAIISSTAKVVPADKKIYALRDVTGTVNSLPLIASSIMSKKLATGADAVLLDVKCGDGAFMKTEKDAIKLAQIMVKIGLNFNRDIRAYITDMSVPLGRTIGNKIEVLEAITTLKGNGPKDFEDLIENLSATLLIQAKIFTTKKEAINAVKKVIKSGLALEKFYEFIQAQGGDLSILKSKNFWKPKYKSEILAEQDGYMEIDSAIHFGIIAMRLGAGRKSKEDSIDYDAGIYIHKKTGEKVQNNDVLFTLYSSNPIPSNLVTEIKNFFVITNKQKTRKIILNYLSEEKWD